MMTEKSEIKCVALLVVIAVMATVGSACQPVAGLVKSQPSPATTAAAPIAYVGTFSLSPNKGPAGTAVKAIGEGFQPGVAMDISWQSFQGSWKTQNENFLGRDFKDKMEPVARVQTDANGKFEASFTAPDGFGFVHDVVVTQDGAIRNKAAFEVSMAVSLSPDKGPLGAPITLTAKGIGWRPMENSWVVTYDNKFTGWLSSVTTNGNAAATIPATGTPGKHIIQILHASSTFPYMNMQQSPEPDRPFWTFEFIVTDGAPALPPAVTAQTMSPEQGKAPSSGKPSLWTDLKSGTIDTRVDLKGTGFTSGQKVDLLWSRVKGSRVSGQGWEEEFMPLSTVSAGPDGAIDYNFTTPDDLGGQHNIEARVNGEKVANTAFEIRPSALPIQPASGPAGTNIVLHLKGVGWTETANIYTLVYDNAYLGYACGFNSQGDVTINLPAAGDIGWHFIDLYPAIYKGKDMDQTNDFRLPQLTYKDDHPGERLPAFHFAFQVTK